MKLKKPAWLIIVLAAMVLLLPILPARAFSFVDLSDSWAAEDILALSERGMFEGMIFADSSRFEPWRQISRAEFLLMLFNSMGLDLKARDATLSAPFADLAAAPEAYRPYLIEGYQRGVMLGKTDLDGSLFADWNAPLSRQEAVTVLGRVLNAFSDRALTFSDSDEVAAWARDYVAALSEKGLINGMPDGSFAPRQLLSRAEASRLMYTLITRKLFVPTEMRVYAGSTDLGYQDGSRLNASFGAPLGLFVTGNNALLIADKEANTLRRVSGDSVTTIAGQTSQTDLNGLPARGYKDDALAAELMLGGPRYLCQAPNGNIYYTDGGNNALRMITAEGRGYTLSGNGQLGYVNGAREKTQFNLPSGIAVAGGLIYVADTLNNCIRVINTAGVSALYAGTPGETGGYRDGTLSGAMFCQPTDLQFGADGALYIADTGNSLIRVIRNGQVSTLAGQATPREELSGAMQGGYLDGPAEQALFRGPLGLAVAGGVVFVADTENNVIRKIEAGYVTTVAGCLKAGNSTGPALVSMLNSPADVAVINGRIYVSDSNNHCIKVFGAGLEE